MSRRDLRRLSLDAAFDFSRLSTVMSTALSVSVIGYMESIAIAKSLASKHKYEVSAGQELFALGLSNVFGSLTSSYPVTGSFSRSAVNNTTGAKTNFAGIITALVVIIVLVALTKVFQFLPKFCLAAIVIASVTNLVDIKEFRYLWKVKKPDCLLWVLAFLGTLFLGVQNGLLGAVGASLVLVIYESVRPQIAVLWRLPETPIYRNIKQESLGQFVPGVLIVRLGASMYFANVAYIRDHISSLVLQFSEGLCAGAPVQYVIIEMTPVITIDSSALHVKPCRLRFRAPLSRPSGRTPHSLPFRGPADPSKPNPSQRPTRLSVAKWRALRLSAPSPPPRPLRRCLRTCTEILSRGTSASHSRRSATVFTRRLTRRASTPRLASSGSAARSTRRCSTASPTAPRRPPVGALPRMRARPPPTQTARARVG